MKNAKKLGPGEGQVVNVLAFYSNNPSSNPAKVYNCYSVKLLKQNENKQKIPFKKNPPVQFHCH